MAGTGEKKEAKSIGLIVRRDSSYLLCGTSFAYNQAISDAGSDYSIEMKSSSSSAAASGWAASTKK